MILQKIVFAIGIMLIVYKSTVMLINFATGNFSSWDNKYSFNFGKIILEYVVASIAFYWFISKIISIIPAIIMVVAIIGLDILSSKNLYRRDSSLLVGFKYIEIEKLLKQNKLIIKDGLFTLKGNIFEYEYKVKEC